MNALTLKLLGAALLVLAGGALGGGALGERRSRERTLRRLGDALGAFASELAETRAPLPEIVSRLRAEPFFAMLSAGFGTEPLETLWRRAALAQPIPEDCRTALASLGAVAGRCTAERQAEEIGRVRRTLLRRGELLQREIAGRARLFPGLGAAAGAILAVLLF